MRRVLAISTGGGHWVQLMRLRPALEGNEIVYVTVEESARCDVGPARFYAIQDGGRNDKIGLLLSALQIVFIILRHRPHVIISTGAAAGCLAVIIGKKLGSRTIWVDSIANVDCISKAGSIVRSHADLWLTQWAHLKVDGGPEYWGSVL